MKVGVPTVRLAARGVAVLKASLAVLDVPAHRVGLSTSYAERPEQIVARAYQRRILTAALDFAVAA